MDLYEHQARELFERHGILVPEAEVADHRQSRTRERPQARRRPARRRGQGTGEDGRPGQGRRREEGGRRGRRRDHRPPDPRHGHQGPHRAQRDARPTRRHRAGVLRLLRPRPRGGPLPRHRLGRGRHGDRGGRRRRARRPSPASPSTRPQGVTGRDGRRDRRGRRTAAADVAPVLQRLWQRAGVGGRPARRGQPARPYGGRRRSSPSTARSPSTTTPASGRPVGAIRRSAAHGDEPGWRPRRPPRASTT